MSRGMTAGVLLLTMSAGWTFSAELRQEEHFDFSMCKFGKIDYPAFAKGLTSGSFDRITASLFDAPADPGRSRCDGTYEIVGGAYHDQGTCVRIDADGDRLLMQYQTGADLSGRWTTLEGSGKYKAVSIEGVYSPVGNVPGVMPGGFKTCNRYTGISRMN